MAFDFFNIKLNENKSLFFSFRIIFGLNYPKMFSLYKLLGLNLKKQWTLENLNVNQIYLLKIYLPDLFVFDSELKRRIALEKEKFLELKCYKRNRYLLNLPVNGQRTRSNARTKRRLKN